MEVPAPGGAEATDGRVGPVEPPGVDLPEKGGVLSVEKQRALAEVAEKFISETEAGATEIARSLGYLETYGHPSNTCGPLAAAILRQAGVIEPYVDLHDFWLLNPREGYTLRFLEGVFPAERFLWITEARPVNQIDFSAFPLYPGDFLYLYAGANGTFEHILTVTRVDEAGRAFTVTNVNTDDGYLIKELMLYDPSRPGEGLFYDWTDRSRRHLGLTGFGGFQLWRLKEALPAKGPREVALAGRIDHILEEAGGHWNVLIKALGGDEIYAREAYERLHPASVVKVPIAMLFFEALDSLEVEDVSSYISVHGVDGRTYQQLLYAMLVHSEESAAQSLAGWTVARLDVQGTLRRWGVEHTTIAPRRSTVRDLSLLLEGLYAGDLVTPEAREIILGLMAEYTPNDETRIGVLREVLDAVTVYNKRGTISGDGSLLVADSAIVEVGDAVYVLVIFGYPKGHREGATTYVALDRAIEGVALSFAEYLRPLSGLPKAAGCIPPGVAPTLVAEYGGPWAKPAQGPPLLPLGGALPHEMGCTQAESRR